MNAKVALASFAGVGLFFVTVHQLLPVGGTLALHWATGANAYLGLGDLHLQEHDKSCGPAALRYLLHRKGIEVSESELALLAGSNQTGTTMLGLAQAAQHYGFQTDGWKLDRFHPEELHPPVIVHLPNHFAVVTEVTPDKVFLADPGIGILVYSHADFSKRWDGIILSMKKGV